MLHAIPPGHAAKAPGLPSPGRDLPVAVEVVAQPRLEPFERGRENLPCLAELRFEGFDPRLQAARPLALLLNLRMLDQVPQKSHASSVLACDYLPRKRPRELRAVDDRDAVDEDVLDTLRILMRLEERRLVADRREIEDHEVGRQAFADQAAVLQAHDQRGERSRRADRVLDRDGGALERVVPDLAREAAVE